MCQDYWGKAYSYLEGPLSPNQTRTELAINMIFLRTLSLWDSTISPLILLVTKTEFLLKTSIKYQVDKLWE